MLWTGDKGWTHIASRLRLSSCDLETKPSDSNCRDGSASGTLQYRFPNINILPFMLLHAGGGRADNAQCAKSDTKHSRVVALPPLTSAETYSEHAKAIQVKVTLPA